MRQDVFYPQDYRPALDVLETERAIKLIKDFFQIKLAVTLNLRRVTAPLFVEAGAGINDDLNGVERPVSFSIKEMDNTRAEIVQSLAKWKRLTLADLRIPEGEGIYADMNAIRPDEMLDNLHSIYVDQWDWERVITAEERNLLFLEHAGVRSMKFSSRPSTSCAGITPNSSQSCPTRSPSSIPRSSKRAIRT